MAAFDLLINFGNNSFELSDTLNTLYFCRIHCIFIWFIMIQLIVFMKWPILHKYFRELRLFSAYLIYRNKSLAYGNLQIPFYLKIQKEVYTGAFFLICWVCKDNKPSDCFCLKKNVAITGTIIHIIQDIFSPRRLTSKVIIIQTFDRYSYYQLFTFFENLVQHDRLEQQIGTLWPFNGIRW